MPDAFGPPEQQEDVRMAVKAWNMMGGLDWTALPIVAEVIGYDDIEKLISQMILIRDREK